MKDVKTMSLGQKIFSISMIAFTVFYLALITQIPIKSAAELAVGGGPRIFPLIIGITLLVLLIVEGAGILTGSKKSQAAVESSGEQDQEEPESPGPCRDTAPTNIMKYIASHQGFFVILLILSLVLYQVLISYIGFIASTALYLMALFRIFGVKNWIVLTLTSLVFSVLFYLLFELVFGVRLEYMGF